MNKNNETDVEVEDYISTKEIEMTGEEFCTYFPNLSKRLVKFTNATECHHGFKFETGLNVDNIPFDPTSMCKAGGIYFTDIDNIPGWLDYGNDIMKYCRTVILPSDCRVYIEDGKFKADKIILGDRVEIGNLPCWSDNNYCLNAARMNLKFSFKYIRNINISIQYVIIGIDPLNIIKLLENNVAVPEEIQIAALDNPRAQGYGSKIIEYLLKHGVKLSKEVKIKAMKNDTTSFKHLLMHNIKVSEKIQLLAVKNNYQSIKYLLEHNVNVSEKVQLEAVKDYYVAIYYLLEHGVKISNEVKMVAVKQNWSVIKKLIQCEIDIPKEVQLEAVKQDWYAIETLLKNKIEIPEEVQIEAIKITGMAFEYLSRYGVKLSEKVLLEAKQERKMRKNIVRRNTPKS